MQFEGMEKGYEEILRNARETGEIGDSPDGDRRNYPRLKIRAPEVRINGDEEASGIDLSRSGIAFEANYPLAVGEQIHLSLGTAISINGEVVACTLVGAPGENDEAGFRIQCKFGDEYRGMEMVVETRRKMSNYPSLLP